MGQRSIRVGTRGGYFLFEFRASDYDPNQLVGASLNVNYFRPHIFGLEAELEVRAFVEHFQLDVEDPQMHGMGRGPYTQEGFLAGWNAGNEFGYKAITSQHKGPFLAYSEAKIEAAWRWNRAKSSLQEEFGEILFVPTIMFAAIDGHLRSAVVWGDGIPTLMPQTEAVIVVRDDLGPKPLFRPRTKDTCVVAPDNLVDLLGPFVEKDYTLPVRVPTLHPIASDPIVLLLRLVLMENLIEKCLFND